MLPCDGDACTSQAPRVGLFAGSLVLTGLTMALERPLHLDQRGEGTGALATMGLGFGVADGLMLAGALDDGGLIATTPGRQIAGGMLLGASAELTGGLLLSKTAHPSGGDVAVIAGGKLTGGLMGAGLSILASDSAGRAETIATLAGSLVGEGAAAALQATAPLRGDEAPAMSLGLTLGGFAGTLAPTLGNATFGGLEHRATRGGLLLGTSAGLIGGLALERTTGASTRTVGLAAAGGADGLLTGLGIGLLAGHEGSSRAERIGVLAGAGGGAAVGALGWSRLTLDEGDAAFVGVGTAAAGWTGALISVLGHASLDDVPARTAAGSVLAGAGVASIGTSLLAPLVKPSPDAVANAAGMDALFSAAGAGVGLLASQRADGPAWGMLGAGTAGLVTGGLLHDAIDVDGSDAPLLSLAGVEGLWFGGWLPVALYAPDQVNERHLAGGLLAGGAAGLGLGLLGDRALALSPRREGLILGGSAVGAALGGGLALLTPSQGNQRGAEMVMGGTAIGLATGALLKIDPSVEALPIAGGMAAGAALGAAEASVFAWSAHAGDSRAYGGSALLGAGIGASLGLAAAAMPPDDRGTNPAVAGFGAWGAWMGSFSGALVRDDAHEVVLGGLIGANVGLLGGYELLASGLVQPRDFGWLSLFGALGTVAGAGAGAPFATKDDTTPLLAGLAVGPAAGMLTGALVLPRLHSWLGGGAAPGAPTPHARRHGDQPAASDDERASRDGAAHEAAGDLPETFRLGNVIQVTEWSPLVGALPAPAEQGPAPLLFGVTGRWH